jgi:cell division protein ZapA
MPELLLEIGGRMYEVACEAGQETSLESAAALLDVEAQQLVDTPAAATEKRMLLLSGLMLADTLQSVKSQLAAAEESLHQAEDRIRIAEAKSAMLAANALKAGGLAARYPAEDDVEQLRAENEVAVELLSKVLNDLNALADEIEAGKVRLPA